MAARRSLLIEKVLNASDACPLILCLLQGYMDWITQAEEMETQEQNLANAIQASIILFVCSQI